MKFKKRSLTWNQVCETYPKLRQIGEKYPHLKEVELEISNWVDDKKDYHFTTKPEDRTTTYLDWNIQNKNQISFAIPYIS